MFSQRYTDGQHAQEGRPAWQPSRKHRSKLSETALRFHELGQLQSKQQTRTSVGEDVGTGTFYVAMRI